MMMMPPALQHGARQPYDADIPPQGESKLHLLSLTGALGPSCAHFAVDQERPPFARGRGGEL
jgi:hypothetical protein